MNDVDIDEWRNIQNVVRESFSAMQRVISEHADKLRSIERCQKDAASWTQVESSLAARATIQDVNASLAGLANVLSEKVTQADITAACEERVSRAELQQSNTALTRRLQMVEQNYDELRSELQDLKESLSHKVHRDQLEQYVTRSELETQTCSRKDFYQLTEKVVTREELTAALDTLATRDEVQAALQTRAGVAEVERALAAKTDVDRVMTALGERPSRTEVSDIVSSRLLELRTELAATNAQHSLFGSRTNDPSPPAVQYPPHYMGSSAGMRDMIALLDQKANAKDVELLLASKVDRKELNEVISTRVERTEMESRMRTNAETIANEVQSALLQSQKEVVAVLNKKAYKADVHRSLKTKADVKMTADALGRKPDAMEIKDALSQKLDKTACQRALTAKADVSSVRRLEDQVRQLAGEISRGQGISSEELHKFRREMIAAVDGKADGKHVAALVDQKVSVNDMNEALSRMSSAINTNAETASRGVDVEKVEALSNEVQTLHQRMSTEILCARWIWKSGQLAGPPSAGVTHPGELVPWNIECSNANPAVFRWSADTSSVGADLPGLYEIHVGMFTDKQPRVAVLVNGHAVFSTPGLDHFGNGGTVK